MGDAMTVSKNQGRALVFLCLTHREKGLLWIAHSELGVRAERARAAINTAFGARTEFVTPDEIKKVCAAPPTNARVPLPPQVIEPLVPSTFPATLRVVFPVARVLAPAKPMRRRSLRTCAT